MIDTDDKYRPKRNKAAWNPDFISVHNQPLRRITLLVIVLCFYVIVWMGSQPSLIERNARSEDPLLKANVVFENVNSGSDDPQSQQASTLTLKKMSEKPSRFGYTKDESSESIPLAAQGSQSQVPMPGSQVIEAKPKAANNEKHFDTQQTNNQLPTESFLLKFKNLDEATASKLGIRSSKGSADIEGMNMIKGMMKHAWGGYKTYAWGMDEVRPISKTGRNWAGNHALLATLVDALDTLWIMDMKDEFEAAKEYLKTFSFDSPTMVSVFETNIRVVGGLLSAYDLSGDRLFLDKAREVADKLLPAFDTPTGIPYGSISMQSGHAAGHSWSGGAILAEYGSMQLEFQYLSELTGDPKYREKSMKAIDVATRAEKPIKGLYPTIIDSHSGQFSPGKYTIGASADSFYEYLLKLWLISDTKDEKFRSLYDESVDAIKRVLIKTTPDGNTYLGTGDEQSVEQAMEHLTCFAGGMFVMGAVSKMDANWEENFSIGEKLTETCYKMYSSQRHGISAEKTDVVTWKPVLRYYILRPEVIESIFYMWRLTHDSKYREWGMKIAQAIETVCKKEGGYAGIHSVDIEPLPFNDNQESFFLAETLKYLYLLFTDDDVIPIDQYVFNTEAHPFSTVRHRRDATNQ